MDWFRPIFLDCNKGFRFSRHVSNLPGLKLNLSGIVHPLNIDSAVTNARFASLHALPVAPSPSRRRPFRFSNRALVTSFHIAVPHQRRASVCGSAAALRSGFVPAVSPPALHFSRSPTADRSQLVRIREQGAEFANQ